jgi:hypothetical protein
LEEFLNEFILSRNERSIVFIPHNAVENSKLLWRLVCDSFGLEYPNLEKGSSPVFLDSQNDFPVVAFVFDKCKTKPGSPITTIMIPHWESYGFLRMCLWSIRKHFKENEIEILVLDDESSSETYRKIESLCEKYSAKLMRISRPNKRTVADVGLLLDLGIENVKTKYVCMLDADTIHLTSDVYDQLLPLLSKRTVVSVGLDTGLGSSYHQNSSWGHVKDLFPYDISYPKQQTVTNNLFRIMRTADALSVARTAKFSRQVENRKLRDQFGRVLRRVSGSTNFSWLQDRVKGFLLSPVLNSHYPSMPPTGDNGVSANYWMEANGMGRKVNIPITSFGFRSASDGICFQNVSDLIVHVALSTRALSTERREISDAGVEFYEAVQNIVEATKSEEELFEEILSRSRKIAIDLTQ